MFYYQSLKAANEDASLDLNDDVLGLIVFKSDLHDPPALSSWTEDDASPCSWKFIMCNPSTSRVSGISPAGLGLSGGLGKGLQKLEGLKVLSLSSNNLTGPIPSTLSNCAVLTGLNISNNHFSGTPFTRNGKIFALKKLRLLDLSNNLLSGSVPPVVYALHKLKELRLQGNQFSTSIPFDIGLCPHLLKIDLSSNSFTGEIPTSFGTLNSLVSLDLGHNTLSGEFPQWVGNLTKLQFLDVSNNGLTGVLPMSMGNLRSLYFLSLSNNQLTRNLPTSIVQCTELKTLQLKGNLFNGSHPESLFSMGLEEMDLSENSFSGSIPPASG